MGVNRSAILDLAAFIEEQKYEFDMGESDANPSCGTAGCIAGHAAVLWKACRAKESHHSMGEFTFDQSKLAKKLGITDEQSEELFYEVPRDGGHISYENVNRCMAVRALRRLADTGEVLFELPDED